MALRVQSPKTGRHWIVVIDFVRCGLLMSNGCDHLTLNSTTSSQLA